MVNLLKDYRVKNKLTQSEVAQMSGYSQPYINDLERGNRGAKPETWEKLARALGGTVEELMGEDAPQKQGGKEG